MIVTVGILLLVAAGVSIALRGRAEGSDGEWGKYLSRKRESTERLLGPMAKAFSRSGAVSRMARDGGGPDSLRRQLELGGAFNGQAEIYYSMQLAALVTSACVLALAFLDGISPLNRFSLVGVGIIIAVWPYNKVRSAAKEKAARVLNELPEFADLLLMVVSSITVTNALGFTAERTTGFVSSEIKELVRMLNGVGRGREAEAFAITAARLGTPEGREFIAALQAAYLEGTTAAASIKAQVENLRMLKFQQQRAKAKRLPVSLIVTFAVHFMPLLFILAFLPVLSSLAGL